MVYYGLATINKKVNSTNQLYNLFDDTDITSVTASNEPNPTIHKYSINDTTTTYLGFQNLDNSRLNFKIQIIPTYVHTTFHEYFNEPLSPEFKEQCLIRQEENYTLTISKIVLNWR